MAREASLHTTVAVRNLGDVDVRRRGSLDLALEQQVVHEDDLARLRERQHMPLNFLLRVSGLGCARVHISSQLAA